jgi:hypothetical protein
MTKIRESQLYKPIREWLVSFLKRKYRNIKGIWVDDTSKITVDNFILRKELTSYISYWSALKVSVDITGAVLKNDGSLHLAIVEVKTRKINLRDLSQVIGYAKVIKPDYAFIISPNGWSKILKYLILDLQRTDVLEYDSKKKIIIGKWDMVSNSLRAGDILTPKE